MCFFPITSTCLLSRSSMYLLIRVLFFYFGDFKSISANYELENKSYSIASKLKEMKFVNTLKQRHPKLLLNIFKSRRNGVNDEMCNIICCMAAMRRNAVVVIVIYYCYYRFSWANFRKRPVPLTRSIVRQTSRWWRPSGKMFVLTLCLCIQFVFNTKQ